MDLVDAAFSDDNMIDQQVRLILEAARSAAIAADALIRDIGLNGELKIRLIDASHALHRVSGVLTDDDSDAGPATGRKEADCPTCAPIHGNNPSKGLTEPVVEALAPGTDVEVRSSFDQRWMRGFSIAHSCDGGFWLRRSSDGAVLPTAFAVEVVRSSGAPVEASGRLDLGVHE